MTDNSIHHFRRRRGVKEDFKARSGSLKGVDVKEREMPCWLGRWAAPTFTNGTFDVYVSVGEADGTPLIELPLPEDDGNHRYRVGRMTFKEGLE